MQPAAQLCIRRATRTIMAAYPHLRGPLRYLLVLDFEATCGDAVKQMEIIEFPTLLYDLQEGKVKATFHEYVKPEIHSRLTPFCTELTGITQETVDAADTFPTVWKRFQDFLESHGLLDPKTMDSHIFVTCGDWDLKTMLPNQLRLVNADHGMDESGRLIAPYNRWINIKTPFKKRFNMTRYNVGMPGMLKKLQLELEGRHHSGIDDCKNILRIAEKMLASGWDPNTTQPSVSPGSFR